MEPKSKIEMMSDRDMCWSELREQRERLGILVGHMFDPKPIDFLLFYQCVVIVLIEITIFKDDIHGIDENFDTGSMGLIKSCEYWDIINNEDIFKNDRLETLEKLRASSWKAMIGKEELIESLLQNNLTIEKLRDSPWKAMIGKEELIESLLQNNLTIESNDMEEILTLIQCVAIVSLELALREKEIELLYL